MRNSFIVGSYFSPNKDVIRFLIIGASNRLTSLGSKPTNGLRKDHINLLCSLLPISNDETQADRKIHMNVIANNFVARIDIEGLSKKGGGLYTLLGSIKHSVIVGLVQNVTVLKSIESDPFDFKSLALLIQLLTKPSHNASFIYTAK